MPYPLQHKIKCPTNNNDFTIVNFKITPHLLLLRAVDMAIYSSCVVWEFLIGRKKT